MFINKNIKKLLGLLVALFVTSSVLFSCDTKTDNKTNTESKKVEQKDEKKQVTNENLSQTELDFFTNYFSDINNNGFLLCNYDDPTQLDLGTVLYAGAGCDRNMAKMSDAERSAYLEAAKADEIYLDLHRITVKQINTLLQEKVEITLSQVSKKLPWIYLKDYDTYYQEQGDTNFCTFTCKSGDKTSDGYYVIQCINPNADNGQLVNKCEVKLKKVGDLYIFQSNKIEK